MRTTLCVVMSESFSVAPWVVKKGLFWFVLVKGKQAERGYPGEPGKHGEKVRALHCPALCAFT